MDYRVVMMEGAEENIDRFGTYLLFEKSYDTVKEKII